MIHDKLNQPSDSSWLRQEATLLQFEEAWRHPSKPSIEDFVSDRNHGNLSHRLLLELCKIDLEHRLRRGHETSPAEYVARFPQLSNSDSIAELDHFAAHIKKRLSGKQPMPRVGDTIRHYELNSIIGEGSFAVVFAAWDTALRRDVAVKILRPGKADRQAVLQRMRREALAIASLQHPNIVPVYDAGSFAGVEFIVTRLIDGSTLEETLTTRKLDTREASTIVCRLAEALDTVHRQGIVHRDVKPSNVLMDRGNPLLFDFGLAHVTDASLQLTVEGDLLGTPAYMSPEQAAGQGWQVDQRSDIYSLGALLFRLTCDRLPFEGTMAEVVHQVIERECPDPTAFAPRLDRDLRTIILKCMAKEPTDRYATSRDLADDLRRFLDGRAIQARPLRPMARALRWGRRRPVVTGLILTSIVLTAFFIGATTQLSRARRQRDRAVSAESQAEALMTQASFAAGALAAQRGQFANAEAHFLRCLDQSPKNKSAVLLQLANVAIARRDMNSASNYRDQLAEQQLDTKATEQRKLLEAELARRTDFLDSSLAYLQSIDLVELPSHDADYVRAQLADTTPAAIEFLRQACSSDPYDYRSRKMLIVTLFSLARCDEALAEILIARQFFDSAEFRLMEGLIRSALGEHPADGPERSQVATANPVGWQAFSELIHHVTQVLGVARVEHDFNVESFADICTRFNAQFAPLLREHDWRLPVRVAHRFQRLPAELEHLQEPQSLANTPWLEDLVDTHPEGSLFLVLGTIHLSHVSTGNTTAAADIKHLQQARDNFRKAKRYSRFVGETAAFAPFSEFTVSLLLATRYAIDVEQNLAACVDTVSEMNPDQIRQPKEIAAICHGLIEGQAYEQAGPWLNRWEEVASKDDPAREFMTIRRAIVHRHLGQWLELADVCAGYLTDYNASHHSMRAFHAEALEQLNAAISVVPTSDE